MFDRNKINAFTIVPDSYKENMPDYIKLGKLILNTAIGKVRKNVNFIKYDENYVSAEMKEVELFKKNHLN